MKSKHTKLKGDLVKLNKLCDAYIDKVTVSEENEAAIDEFNIKHEELVEKVNVPLEGPEENLVNEEFMASAIEKFVKVEAQSSTISSRILNLNKKMEPEETSGDPPQKKVFDVMSGE